MTRSSREDIEESRTTVSPAMADQPRLGRAGMLIFVVVLPVLIVGALWLTMDRSRGTPRPDMSGALGPGQRAPVGSELPPAVPPDPAPSVQ